MYDITICIPTYRRPAMLEKLILSIADCRINERLIKHVSVIVVDNDIEKSAEKIVSDISFEVDFDLFYFNYPKKGLSNIRNELIKQAFLLFPDFIIFVDDDEYVVPVWLNELLNTAVSHNADAVRGPVLAVCEPTTSKFISCWFQREKHHDSSQLFALTTGNLLLRVTSLKKFNISFDERFNLTGSEDTFFGLQILKKGAKIFWSENAIAYEKIPQYRTNLNWLLKRIYRTSSTYSYCLRIEKKHVLMVKKALVSLIYIFIGVVSLVALVSNHKKKYWGALKIAEGLGGLGGLISITYNEYKT